MRELQLYFPVRCGFWSSDPGLWNTREAFASPDWWIKPKQTQPFKNPSVLCWNYEAAGPHLRHRSFSLLLSFTFLCYLSYLYLGPLCVWYVYRKSITATRCQHWGAEQEKKKTARAFGEERQRTITLGATEDLSCWMLNCRKHRAFCRRWTQGSFVPNWPRWSQLSRMSLHQSIPLTGSCVFFLYIQHVGVFQENGWGTGLSLYNILHWDLCNCV